MDDFVKWADDDEEEGEVRWFHIGIAAGCLLRLTDEQLEECIAHVSKDEVPALRERLRNDAADGVRYPLGNCGSWDKHHGCPGHSKK